MYLLIKYSISAIINYIIHLCYAWNNFVDIVQYKILEGENFGELQVIGQNFLLWMIKSIREMVCMALLKYFQLKTTCKQPLPNPNGELSSKIPLS